MFGLHETINRCINCPGSTKRRSIQPVTLFDSCVWNCQTSFFNSSLFFFYTIHIMDMHTRAIEAFRRSEFHAKYPHRKPGMYDPSGHGSRERQGRPWVLPEDKAPPIRTESIASSSSYSSGHSER